MLGINLKIVFLNNKIIAELIESGKTENPFCPETKPDIQNSFPSFETDNIEQFFHWLWLPAHLASEELELLALQKKIHVLISYHFAMQNENKSSYVQISIASLDTENDLRKRGAAVKNIFKEKQMNFFV